MQMSRHRLAAAVLAVISSAVFAEDDSLEIASLDTVIVTATRTPEKAEDALAPVTVITREDIDRLQPRDFQDLLVGLPGLAVTNNGGPGKATSLQLRGTNADHVVVLIDGIKIGSATLGTTAFEQLPVDQVDHVEIVRGPRSSLYGSEAIGGVIQIFTKRAEPGDTSPVPSFALGGGNLGSGKFEAGIRGGAGSGGWYSLGVSGETTDGIDVQPAAGEPDRDGFHSIAGSANTGWRFANGAEISASWLRAASHNKYDGSYTNESDNTQQVFGGHARFSPLTFWTVTLSAGESQDLSENDHDPLVDDFMGGLTDNRSTIDTYRDSYSWQNDLALAAGQQLSAGVDFEHDRVGGTTGYVVASRDNAGLFAQYQGRFAAHELQASLRADRNEQFGAHNTGSAAYGYRFGNGVRVGASYGTAFKAPSFNDLYFPGYGVPTLHPEKSRSSELSIADTELALWGGVWNWSLNGYRTTVDQLIVYNPGIPPFGAPDNIGSARIIGTELQVGARFDALSMQTYLNWLDPENRSDDANHGKILPRRARQTARFDLDYDWRRASLGTTLNATGRRYDNPANSTELGAYATLDLRASWQLLPQWQLQLKAANVLDRHYQIVAGYAQFGATYLAMIRYTPTGSRSQP